jgi:hypothetical protein
LPLQSAPAAAVPVAPDVPVVAEVPALLSLPHADSVSPAIAVADTVARTALPNELRFTDPTFLPRECPCHRQGMRR